MDLDSKIYFIGIAYFQEGMLTKTQVKVILILLDEKGHAGWELAQYLHMEESNLNHLLKDLESKRFIFQGPPRRSQRPKRKQLEDEKGPAKREGDYKEFPYFLSKNLEDLKNIIREIIQSQKIYDTAFVVRIIEKSKYKEAMGKIFEENFRKCIADELRKSYPAYSDKFFTERIEPSLVEGFFLESPDDMSLKLWYMFYKNNLRRAQKVNNSPSNDSIG